MNINVCRSSCKVLTIVENLGWAQRSVWTEAGNFVTNGISSPYRPARSESLYLL